jgi:hypothetical protein
MGCNRKTGGPEECGEDVGVSLVPKNALEHVLELRRVKLFRHTMPSYAPLRAPAWVLLYSK